MSSSQAVQIRGMGCYVPERVVMNDELEARMGLAPGWIQRKTGVQERRWADADMTAATMAGNAARDAITDAQMVMTDISLIINASGTAQRFIPDNAPLIQREMGYGNSGIPCMSVHSTCLSFMTGFEVATALLQSNRYRNILLLTSEIASRGLDFTSPESASLFGDAATATVLSLPESGNDSSALHAYRMETYGDGADLTTVRTGTENLPGSAGYTTTDALFQMDGKRVYKFAQKRAKGFLQRFLPDYAQQASSITAVIPHQSTLLGILSLKHQGIDLQRVVITLTRFGNCVASSIPLTLYQAIADRRLRRGERFLMVGTGAGLSIAAALVTY